MKKSTIILLIFLIMIICVSAVSAADDVSDDLAASDEDAVSVSNDDIVSASDSNTVLAAGEANFGELQGNITGKTGTVELSSSFKRNSTEDTSISVNSNLIIDGKSHTIDNSGSDKPIFTISANNVTLRNMNLINATVAVQNAGNLTLENVVFTGCKVTSGTGSQLTVSTGCNFGDNDIVLQDTAKLLSNAVVVVKSTPENIVIPAAITSTLSAEAYVDDKKINVTSNWAFTGADVIQGNQFTPQKVGTYKINASNSAIVNAQYQLATVSVNTGKTLDSTITIDYPNDAVYNDTIKFKVTIANQTTILGEATPSGEITYKITLGESTVMEGNKALVNGTATITMEKAKVGKYTILVNYAGDENFKANSRDNYTTVSAKTPEIIITVDNSTKFGEQTIDITMPSDVPGTITVKVNGTEFETQSLTEGKASFKVNKAVGKNYEVIVEYTGEAGNYVATATNSTLFDVNKVNTPIIISGNNVTQGTNLTFTIQLADDINDENVTIDVTDIPQFNKTLTNGFVSVDLGQLTAKEYTITVNYAGNDVKYAAATNTTTLKVSGAAPEIVINVGEAVLFEDVTVTVNITNNKTTTESTVDIYVNNAYDGKAIFNQTTGVYEYTIKNISVGEKNITANFTPSTQEAAYLTGGNNTEKVTVAQLTPEITVDVGKVELGQPFTVKINLTNNGTSNAATGKVTLKVDNYPLGDRTLTGGATERTITTSEATLTAGEHTLYVTYEGDKNYTDATKEYKFNVEKHNVNIAIEVNSTTEVISNVTINVTVTSGYGFVGEITVIIKNSTGTVSSKIISFNEAVAVKQTVWDDKLPLGNYTVEVSYNDAESPAFNTNSTNATFKVVKAEPTIVVVDYTANVNYPTQAIVNITSNAKGKYTIYANGTKVAEGTIDAGVVTNATLYVLTVGNYEINVTYVDEDNVYATKTVTAGNLAVNNGTIEELNVTVSAVDYPDTAFVNITASVAGNYTVTVKNENYTAEVTTSGAVVSVPINLLDVGDYPVTVTSNITNYNIRTNTTATLTVNKGTIASLNVTVENVVFGNNATVSIKASEDGRYNVTIDGDPTTTIYTIDVVNGEGSVTVGKYNVGTYLVIVVSNITNYNTKVNNTVSYNVTNATIDVNVTVDNVVYPTKAIVYVNATVPEIYTLTIDGSRIVSIDVKTLKDGIYTGNTTLDLLAAGDHYVNVTATILNYNVVNQKADFTVEKGTILFNFTAISAVDYPNGVIIAFNTNVDGINATQDKGYLIALYDNATGNLIKEIDNVNTNGNIDLGILAPGTYKLRATAIAGDEGFANYTVAADNTTYNETVFTVNPGTIGVTVEVVGTVKYPDNATIKVTANVTDTYIVKVNGEEYSVFVNAYGSNTTTIKLLDVGKYTVNVTSTNANYTKATNDTELEVVNGTIGVSISVDNVNYPAIPVATVTANVTGTYTIIVNGKEYTVDINVTKSNTEKVALDKGVLYPSTTAYDANISATIKNYDPVKNSTTFTVGSGAINLTITVANVVYGNKPVANVSANVTGKYNVTFKGKDYIVNITSENGAMAYATVELDEILAVGSYDQVKVESMDGNYTPVFNETSFRVTQADPVILITVENAKFHENCTVYVEIEKGTGKVTFYNDGISKGQVSLVDGKANYTFVNVAVDYYNIKVSLTDDVNLTDKDNYTSFRVEQAQSELTVDGGNCVYNETSVINITVTPNNGTAWEANGNVVITGNLSNAAVALLPGAKVSIDFGKLAAGTYNINITYYGNQNYTAVYDKAYNFTVQKATPVITVSANNATYPNNVTVDFTNNVAGNLTIIYAGKDGSQQYDLGIVEAGSWTYNLTGLYAGDYTVYLKYNEGQNYTAVTVNDTFTVKQSTPVISAIVVPATYPDAAVVNVTSNIDGTYTITVLNAENNTVLTKTGDFIAGEYVNVTLDVIAAGNYKVNVTYNENVNYTSVTEQYNLVISKGTPVISIVTVNSTFPNRALVNFTSDVEGDFNFTIGDVVGNGTFVNGELTIELPFVGAVGTYPVTLTYKENENYTSVPETGSLTIEKGTAEINITVDTITALEDATLTVNIPNATGNFTLYGTSLPTAGIVIELTDGVATYNIGKLNPGNYSYVVEYSGDHNLSGDVEAFTFTVDRLDPNLQITSAHYTWGDKGVVNITIDNKDELTVSISIDGKVVEEFFKVINGSAQYVLPDLAVGKYDIIVSYAGSEMYNASSQIIENLTVSQLTPTIVVPDVTLTYPETGSFVISTNVANMELKVKIGDEDPILIPTDENGNATANIKLIFEAGNYTISVTNVANENISEVTSNATLTVNKANINLTVTGPVNVTYPENVTFTIKTDVAGNYTIDINGDSKVYEIAAGESIISGLANAGPCTIVVTSADPNYETATATFTTTVLPGTIDITIDAPASAFDQPHTIIITTTVAGEYLINVAGKETNATIKGEFVVPPSYMPNVLEAGNYNITVTSLDPNYKASANATLEVTKAAAKVNITDNADEIMVGDDFTFTVTMSDNFANGNVTIYVDGKENQTVLLDDGYANATVTISGLTAYYHVIGVKYNGNNNYNPSENTTVDVDVYKYTPVITVSVKNATSLVAIAATEATITVTGVKGKATGEITVDYENGTSVTYNLTDGVYVLELYDLTAGTHSIPVYYLGDDIYSYEYTDINFTVTQGSATPVISEVTTPIKYGDDATFTVTLDNTFGPTGNVTITVNNVEVQTVVLDDNCSATVTLTGLAPNTYTIGVKYNGDINFKPSEEVKTTILVEKATPAIAIAFADENLTAIAGTTITVTVADGKATGTVKVIAAGFTKEGTLENGTITLDIHDVEAGDYTVEVTYYGDDNYVKTTANKTFTVAKCDVTPVISEPTSVILVGQNATFIVTMSDNFANGNITVNVDNGKYVYDLALDDQYANVSVYIPGLAAGTHVIGVKYNGNENCNPSEFVNTTIVVNKNDVSKLIAVSTVDGIYNTSSAKVVIELPADAKGNVTISIVGLDNITEEVAGVTAIPMDILLPAGTYGLVQVVYSGDDKYLPYTTQGLLPEFVVNKANSNVTIGDIAAATYPGSVNITYAVTPAFLNATVTVTDAKGNVVKAQVVDNKVILTDLAAGAYTITVFTPGDNNYNNATASKAFSVAKADPTFTTVAAVNVTVGQNMTITVIAPEDATGTVYATVSGELVATGIPLVNGTATIVVPNLAYGQYGYAVTYEGDNNYNQATDINSFEIIKNDVSGNVTIDIPAGASTYEPTFGISNLPSDAQGTLTVTVDGKEYMTNVKNGAASITIPGLSAGNHNVTITYSGDSQYGNITKSDMITLIAPVPKLAGSDLKVLFSGSAKYVVVLTIDGKPAAGEIVSVSFNGAKLSAKTNSKGQATFKLNSKAKIDTYDVKAKYGSVETTNKVTIKNIIKAKNKKVKKSKTTKVKITLSKVDGKYLKGKKLKIKLKGKKYKVKTNKKGKATWKVKPSMIKKLKVGKKYKYTVSYGKDTVTKKLKIKR